MTYPENSYLGSLIFPCLPLCIIVVAFSSSYRPFLYLSRVAFLVLAPGLAWIESVSSLAMGDLSHSSASLLRAHYLYHYLLYLVWNFVLSISLIVFLTLIICLRVSSWPVQHLCSRPWNSEMTVLHKSFLKGLFYSENVSVGYHGECCSSRFQELFGRSQHH